VCDHSSEIRGGCISSAIGPVAQSVLRDASGRKHVWRGLDDNVAQRIALDIRATQAEYDFLKCAVVIDVGCDKYHPLITRVVVPPVPDVPAESVDDDFPLLS
jgi:hypothetical protein